MLLLHYFIETLTRALQSIRRLLCPWNAAGKNIGVGMLGDHPLTLGRKNTKKLIMVISG